MTSDHFETEKSIITELSVAVYPSIDSFRVVEGHLADFGTLSKIPIAPERNRLESSALCISIEDSLTDLAMV